MLLYFWLHDIRIRKLCKSFMRKDKSKAKSSAKTGPKEQRLKLKGDWQALVGKALQKKRPTRGWPKPNGGKK